MNDQPGPKNDDDDYDETPLQYQRPFGAGLHRKPITFVSASSGSQLKSVDDIPSAKPQPNVADLYLSMVLPDDTTRSKSAPPTGTTTRANKPSTCPVCNLPLDTTTNNDNNAPASTPHTQSLAHQLCLPHSQPPSALDRTRMGLSYLFSRGWDPDARRGLGAAQQGIAYPVKARPKDDNLGIGMVVPKGVVVPKKKEQLLDAGKVRKAMAEERKRAERIRGELFGDGRVERYLGKGEGAMG